MKKTISAIVPIFNEEKTVRSVVSVLLKNELINEVICVNDGSHDNSIDVLKEFGQDIHLINFLKNRGKGAALAEGVKAATGEIVAFFDADLINFSDNHIKALVSPVLKNRARVVLGYRSSRVRHVPNVFKSLCGERVYYRKDLLPCLDKISNSRFGVEVFLNDFFGKKKVKKVKLRNLTTLFKYEKTSFPEAVRAYIGEGVEIAKELSKREVLSPKDSQIIATLSKEVDFDGLKSRISEISNKKIRRVLQKYILKYIKAATKWWQNSQ